MNKEEFIDCESNRLLKLSRFRLNTRFKTIGLLIVAISIFMLFVRAFVLDGDTQWLRLLLQKTLVIGLLVMSLAKDKIEDEMTMSLRAQSYAIAFVVGVIYAMVMPYVEFGVSNVVHSGGETFKELGDFQILLFMLMIQLLFYHTLKRSR